MVASAAHAEHPGATKDAPVRSYVRRAWRVLALRRATEALGIGVAALVVGVAASVASGAAGLGTEVWLVSGVVGWLAASSWWLEHAPNEAAVARDLDGDGALVTAYECEVSGRRSPIAELLSLRVAQHLAASGRRVARMPSALILAVLLASGALLMLALDSSSSSRLVDARRSTWVERARAFVAAVEDESRALPADLADGVADELGELAREASTLAAARAPESRLADFAGRARQAALERVHDARVEAALVEAAEAASDLSAALAGRSAKDSGADPGTRAASADRRPRVTPARASGQPAAGGSSEPGAAPGVDSGTDMLDGPPDVTMLPLDSGLPPDPGVLRGPEAERGLPGLRWWPRRFDAIVERWVELQRTASDR